MIKKNGFAIGAALAILCICAVFGVFFLKMFVLGQESSARDAMGEKAYQAARAGMEYGAYQSLINSSCLPATLAVPGFTEFTVALSCIRVSTSEAGVPVTVDTWTSLACSGAVCPGAVGPSYVERQIKVTLAK